MSELNQHILGLSITDFKKIGVFNIDLRGKNMVIVSGKNDQGKTSVIDALHATLVGKQYYKEKIENVIKDGKDRADVIISTDQYEIHRYWKANGKDYIKIKDKRGTPQGREESLLASFYNQYSRDPQRMSEMKQDEQVEFIYDLLGLKGDLENIEKQRQEIYDKRTEVNRDLKQKQAKLEAMDEPPEELPEKIDVSKAMDKISQIEQANEKLREKESNLAYEKKQLTVESSQLESKIERLRQELEDAEQELEDAESRIEQIDESLENMPDRKDTSELRDKINRAEQINDAIRKAEEYEELESEVSDLEMESNKKTKHIEALDKEKVDRIAEAKMPIKGMKIEGDENIITYNGTPVRDLGKAESIIFWSRVFMSTNPELKFLTLDDGESLDTDHQKQLKEFAEEEDILFIVTMVDETGEKGIVLEEGEIIKNNYKEENEEEG